MPKKERANGTGSKQKRQEKKRGAALPKKSEAASAEKAAKNKVHEQEVVSAAVTTDRNAEDKKAESQRDEPQSSAKNRNTGEAYRTLEGACAKSKHLAGKLMQQRSDLLLSLPPSLPSTLIFRALEKDTYQYKELHKNRITQRQGHSNELELIVDGMKEKQLITLITELDELIGDFIGRS